MHIDNYVFITELFFPLVVLVLGNIILGPFLGKIGERKRASARHSIWKCPHEKSAREKYFNFLLELILLVSVVVLAQCIMYIFIVIIRNVEIARYEKFIQSTGIGILIAMAIISNQEGMFEYIFGKKSTKKKWKRILLNGPIVILILMFAVMFCEYNTYITGYLGFAFILFEILGLFLDGKTKNKYKKARAFLSNYLKYKDIICSSIREEKKWICFTYVEGGARYTARILKTDVVRIEYYEEES